MKLSAECGHQRHQLLEIIFVGLIFLFHNDESIGDADASECDGVTLVINHRRDGYDDS